MGTLNNDSTERVELEIKSSDPPPTQPTFGRGVLLAAGALNLGCGLGIPLTLSVMFLDWQESFSASRAATAAVQSTCVGISFGGGVVAGYIINRFGARVAFILGSCLAGLGMFVSAFATNITFLLVSTGVVGGCGFSLIQIPCIPCCTRAFRTHQGVAIAVVTAGASLVMLLLPYLYDFLIQTYSWRGAFIIISGLSLNTLVLEMIMTSYVSSPQPKQPQQHLLSTPEAENLVTDGNDVTSFEIPNDAEIFEDKVVSQVDDSEKLPEEWLEFDYIDAASMENILEISDGKAEGKDQVAVTYNDKDRGNCTSDRAFDEVTSLITEVPDVHISTNNGKETTIEPSADEINESDHQDQRETEKNVDILPAIQVDPDGVHSKLSPLKHSPWKFLLDPLAWAVLIYLGPGLAGIFSAQLLVMDIAENKGFPEHGLTLVTAVVIAGLVGKVLSGVLSLCRTLSSFVLLSAVGVLGSGTIFLLGSVSSLPATVASISGLGLSLGMTVSVFPKCFLDMSSVDVASYPLALGVASTMEGIFDLLCPVLVGHMVDVSGTYMLPFSITGGVVLLCSGLILLVFWWTRQKQKK